MTNFVDKLTKEEENKLLKDLRFYYCGDGDFRGTSITKRDGYKVYHTGDHNYSSSKDYIDEYIYISDFDVKTYYDKEFACNALWNFMFNRFGEEWASEAIKYFTNKKAVKKVAFIESLLGNSKVESL